MDNKKVPGMNNDDGLNDEGPDDLDNIVVLTDQNGEDTEFEFLDIVEYDGKEYCILMPVETADDGEVVIFRIEGEGEDEQYVGVEDEEECQRVFEAFREKAKDDFNFVD